MSPKVSPNTWGMPTCRQHEDTGTFECPEACRHEEEHLVERRHGHRHHECLELSGALHKQKSE